MSQILCWRDTRGPLPTRREGAAEGEGVAGGLPFGATWRAPGRALRKNLARGRWDRAAPRQAESYWVWNRGGGSGSAERKRQAGAWGAPAPPAARPLRPGRAEPPQRCAWNLRPEAMLGHEGVAGPAEHLLDTIATRFDGTREWGGG